MDCRRDIQEHANPPQEPAKVMQKAVVRPLPQPGRRRMLADIE
jgi:hypothetical protein